MNLRRICWAGCCITAVIFSAAVLQAAVTVLQVEADGSTSDGYQYAPINFNGTTPVTYSGVTYHALSGTSNTYSSHAATVRSRLLAADGPNNPVNTIYCLAADDPNGTITDFLEDYVKVQSSGSIYAVRPNTLGNGIKIVNNSWVGAYSTTATNTDAVRRLDYMIHREDLVMVNGAVSTSTSSPTPLAWSARNGIAVRGIQKFYVSSVPVGIGKRHADLWGPKTSDGKDDYSSYETPGVGGYAAALIDAASQYGWNNGTNGLRHEVVKSVLMTGADKTDFSTGPVNTGGEYFHSWTSNGINNLDNQNGAGRANYNNSLNILTSGQQTMADVSGTTVLSPTVTTASAGWWYEDSLGANSIQALIVDLNNAVLTDLTATLAWDVTQEETSWYGQDRLNTTDAGVIFANLDLELLPVTYSNGTYTLGSSLGIAGLMSKSTDDNVEHLYFTNSTLDPGYYAFVISSSSNFAWNYGFSYRLLATALEIPEPGTLVLLAILLATLCSVRFVRTARRA